VPAAKQWLHEVVISAFPHETCGSQVEYRAQAAEAGHCAVKYEGMKHRVRRSLELIYCRWKKYYRKRRVSATTTRCLDVYACVRKQILKTSSSFSASFETHRLLNEVMERTFIGDCFFCCGKGMLDMEKVESTLKSVVLNVKTSRCL